jgi:hypothetical protein
MGRAPRPWRPGTVCSSSRALERSAAHAAEAALPVWALISARSAVGRIAAQVGAATAGAAGLRGAAVGGTVAAAARIALDLVAGFARHAGSGAANAATDARVAAGSNAAAQQALRRGRAAANSGIAMEAAAGALRAAIVSAATTVLVVALRSGFAAVVRAGRWRRGAIEEAGIADWGALRGLARCGQRIVQRAGATAGTTIGVRAHRKLATRGRVAVAVVPTRIAAAQSAGALATARGAVGRLRAGIAEGDRASVGRIAVGDAYAIAELLGARTISGASAAGGSSATTGSGSARAALGVCPGVWYFPKHAAVLRRIAGPALVARARLAGEVDLVHRATGGQHQGQAPESDARHQKLPRKRTLPGPTPTASAARSACEGASIRIQATPPAVIRPPTMNSTLAVVASASASRNRSRELA